MNIELTSQQREALDREGRGLRRVVDPRIRAAYVLVPESEYEAMPELFEDERREESIHAAALRNAANRLNESP